MHDAEITERFGEVLIGLLSLSEHYNYKPTILKDHLAGRKQHFLPQHLLRGFGATKAEKTIRVVVYKKGAAPYTTSTEGVAAQRDFYSQPGDGITDTLDDVITAFESSTFNPFLDQARAASTNERLDAESAASAVVHLTVRAAHLRGSFAHLARKMFTRIGEILNEPELLREFVDIDSTSSKSLLSEEIKKALDALPIAALPLKERLIFEKMARFRAREKFDVLMLGFAPALREQLSMLECEIPDIAGRGHTRALQDSLVPAARIDALKRLRWTVLAVELPNHFVLPDCAAIAFTSSGQLQPVAMSSNEEISWVAMPISSNQVLVGYSDQEPPILPELNQYFAKCSLEFFVSSTLQSGLGVLAEHVGEALEVVTHDVLEDSFSKAYPEQLDPAVDAVAVNVRIVPLDTEADHGEMTAIHESIRQIFLQQCGASEASRLESIVITNDVAREVALLRGRALSPYEAAATIPGALELLPGTAHPALRLILPEPVARLLLAADLRLKRSATLLIKHLLGRVSYLDCWFGDIVPMAEGHAFTVRQHIFLDLTQRFASHYYGSVKAGQLASESDLDDGEPWFLHAVTVAISTLEVARQNFLSHANADQLIADVVPSLDLLLCTLASYCGQRPLGTGNRQLLQNSPTCENIVQAGLWDWMNLFGQDLHRHCQSLGSKSSSVEQVLAISEHVERVLWQFGIFLSDTEDGRVWIDACDEERLRVFKQVLKS